MLRAGGVMVLTHCLLLLFLLALQAQNAHSAPIHGQGAGRHTGATIQPQVATLGPGLGLGEPGSLHGAASGADTPGEV